MSPVSGTKNGSKHGPKIDQKCAKVGAKMVSFLVPKIGTKSDPEIGTKKWKKHA